MKGAGLSLFVFRRRNDGWMREHQLLINGGQVYSTCDCWAAGGGSGRDRGEQKTKQRMVLSVTSSYLEHRTLRSCLNPSAFEHVAQFLCLSLVLSLSE